MVLHNNKWDRRAKRNYERKHGITHEPAESEESGDIQIDIPGIDNSWRFRKEESGEQSGEESDIDEDLRRLVATSVAEKGTAQVITRAKSPDVLEQMLEEKKVEQSKIRVLSEEEKQEFYELERKIQEQKEQRSLKDRFSMRKPVQKTVPKLKNNVMELAMAEDRDNYRGLVKKSLARARRETPKATQDDLDRDLAELLGQAPVSSEKNDKFELEELLAATQPHSNDVTKQETRTVKQTRDATDDFLDELLR